MHCDRDPIFYGDLDMAEAEERIVGRCLADEAFLRVCLEQLPHDCMRACPDEVRMIFWALAGMLARGAFDPNTNEAVLVLGLSAADTTQGTSYWTEFADSLFWPQMGLPDYALGLTAALVTAYHLEDATRAAFDAHRFHNPLRVATERSDVKVSPSRQPPPSRQPRGGVALC